MSSNTIYRWALGNDLLTSRPGLPNRNQIPAGGFSKASQIDALVFQLCPRVRAAKILSLVTRYKGHIGNGLSGYPWKIPDLAISVCSQSVQLGGAWSSCRHQQGILLSRKTEIKQILYRAHSISYCHLIIYFTFKKGFRITFKNWKLRKKPKRNSKNSTQPSSHLSSKTSLLLSHSPYYKL